MSRDLTKKQRRLVNRKLRLIEMIREGTAFCLRHQEYINEDNLSHGCRCYTGDHGKKWCQYFEERYEKPREYQ